MVVKWTLHFTLVVTICINQVKLQGAEFFWVCNFLFMHTFCWYVACTCPLPLCIHGNSCPLGQLLASWTKFVKTWVWSHAFVRHIHQFLSCFVPIRGMWSTWRWTTYGEMSTGYMSLWITLLWYAVAGFWWALAGCSMQVILTFLWQFLTYYLVVCNRLNIYSIKCAYWSTNVLLTTILKRSYSERKTELFCIFLQSKMLCISFWLVF